MYKNTLQFLSVVVFVLLSQPIYSAGMVYKCKNAQDKLLYQKTPCADESQAVNAWTPNIKVNAQASQKMEKKSVKPLVIKQGQGKQYYVNAEVNSRAITFVVDTGATIIAVPSAFATSAAMICKKKAKADTANGRTEVCTTTISELKFGDFVLSNVEAVVVKNLTHPLLGMNVLQFFDIEQKDNEMTLSAREEKTP